MRCSVRWGILTGAALMFANSARGGVDPQPFMPDLGRLGAAENLLEAAGQSLAAAVVSHPPDPGLVGRISAIAKQVAVADERVAVVLAAHPPEPGQPLPEGEFVAALLAVEEDALWIAETAELSAHPPDPGAPVPDEAVRSALEQVLVAAYDLADRADAYLVAGSSCDGGCERSFEQCSVDGELPEDCRAAFIACSDECSLARCDAGCSAEYDACLAALGDDAVCGEGLESCLSACAPDTCLDGCTRAFESCQATAGDGCAGELEYCVASCTLSPG